MTSGVATIRIDGREIPYAVVRSNRARLLRLRIGPTPEVRIIVPSNYRLGAIADVLGPHRRWIVRHLDRIECASEVPWLPKSGDLLPYLGRSFVLDIVHGDGPRTVTLVDDRVLVHSPEPDSSVEDLERWYRERARVHLRSRAEVLAPRIGVTFNRIAIKDQKTRWGSCSSRGNLNFNWRLMLAPHAVADYVVIHELAHLRVPNHSPEFWAVVDAHCCDRKTCQRWLRDHGSRLAGMVRLSPPPNA